MAMSGAESSIAFALRELRALAQLRVHEAAEARQAAEQARLRAAAQRAESQAQLARERAERECAEQEREWSEALAEGRRSAERLDSVERAERERALAMISLRRHHSESELTRLSRARQRPPWLLALTALLFAAATAMACFAWQQHLTAERLQRELADRAVIHEQAWHLAHRRAEQAAAHAGQALATVERSLEALRRGVAKPRVAKPVRAPVRAPSTPVVAPTAPQAPAPIHLSRECLTNALC